MSALISLWVLFPYAAITPVDTAATALLTCHTWCALPLTHPYARHNKFYCSSLPESVKLKMADIAFLELHKENRLLLSLFSP